MAVLKAKSNGVSVMKPVRRRAVSCPDFGGGEQSSVTCAQLRGEIGGRSAHVVREMVAERFSRMALVSARPATRRENRPALPAEACPAPGVQLRRMVLWKTADPATLCFNRPAAPGPAYPSGFTGTSPPAPPGGPKMSSPPRPPSLPSSCGGAVGGSSRARACSASWRWRGSRSVTAVLPPRRGRRFQAPGWRTGAVLTPCWITVSWR